MGPGTEDHQRLDLSTDALTAGLLQERAPGCAESQELAFFSTFLAL
jgi:hypothetical protein